MLEDYSSMLDEDVQRVAGKVLSIHETGLKSSESSLLVMSVKMENVCGSFKTHFENVATGGALLRPGAPRVGIYVRHRQFVGTHHLFHTIHGRLAYLTARKIWSFKGSRSLEDMVSFVRDLTEDTESAIFPIVSMLSVTLRTGSPLVIDPAHSLMQRVIERLYSSVVVIQPRVDDTNNLFFMDVVDWYSLVRVVEMKEGKSDAENDDTRHVLAYLTANAKQPTASIGYTRKGVFFVRITFPRGCICCVSGSVGDGKAVRPAVCEGGVEPFVNVVIRFVVFVLVKMRAVGGVC
ncbi:hypothetical protein T484DRAFT_1856271 [Baffinella frigidus]|nr:hypothetical protein T484DRAFT_1856271 [Cryptophyta sp. CCMP2293]